VVRPTKWHSETRIGNELTERPSERVFQKIVEAWNHHGLKATHTRKERKRIKLATLTLTFLIFGGFAFLMPTVQTQDITPTPVPVTQAIPLEGNMTFKVYPDKSIKMNVAGSLEQAIEAYVTSPLSDFSLNLAKSPSGVNLTETKGIIVMKLSPMFSTLLAALDFDIETHGEELRSNTTILFKLPGYLSVNGTLGSFADESTGEGTQDFALTATIWYSIFPKELIQEYVQMFPTFKSLIETQLSELTEGNITLQELTLVIGEIGGTSATLTITGSLVGDFVKGGMALSTNYMELLGIDDSQMAPFLSPEELMMIKTKSADFHIRFDRNELAFKMDSETVIEGDLDKMMNIIMDINLENLLQSPYITPESALMINNILIPTEISTENLNVAFEYSFDGEKLKLDFAVEGLGFKPPTTEAFLTILDEALTGASLPGFSLVLEGGSDEEEFVEIEVPPTTSEPVVEGPRKVVWTVDNLVNLDLVSFKVREWPTLTLTVSQTEVVAGDTVNMGGVLSIEGEPVEGQEVDIAVNDMVMGTVETDQEGGFSFTYTFVDLGSYEVRSSCEFYEKTLESPIATVTVKSPPLLTPELVALLIGIAIAVAVVGYILMKRR
jgi:hypothetical protein